MATDLERLVVSLEARVDKFDKALAKASGDTDKHLGGIEQRFTQTNKAVGASTANLAAQFQDIAVQFQGGASPLTVALQQGTQISQVIGRQGAAGAVSLLSGAFTSLLSPISLLTVGIIALGGVAYKWLTSSATDVKSLDDLIQEHGEHIKALKDAYGDAGSGLDKLFRDNAGVIESLMRGSITALQEQYKKLATDAVRSMTAVNVATDALSGVTGFVTEQTQEHYRAFAGAIDQFRGSVQAGVPDVKAFRSEVAQIEANTADPAIKKIAGALLEMTKEADKASTSLITSQRAIQETGNIASGNVGRIKEFANALTELSKIGLPNLDDRAKAYEGLQKALAAAAGNKGLINAAETEYLASVGRIGQREKEAADKLAAAEAKRLGERNARRAAADEKSFAQDQENVRKSIALLNLEFESLGKSEYERDKARIAIQLESEARKHNQLEIAGTREKINELAETYARASQKVREANGPLNQFARSAADTNRLSQEAALGGLRALEDGLVDIISGTTKASDAFKRMAASIISDLARIAIRQSITGPIASALGGLFGGGGGSFAGDGIGGFGPTFPGRADGGPVRAGMPYTVGERGREVFVPNANGVVIPNSALKHRQGGSVMAPVTISIDARGAQQGVGAEIEEAVRRATAQIVPTVQDAQQRGILR